MKAFVNDSENRIVFEIPFFVKICHGLWSKKLYTTVVVSLAPSRLPSQWSVAPSVTSVTSVG